MREYFDDALVQGWEPLEGSYGLPDIDDEHVVAAAVVGNAGAIVTENSKDFPGDRVPANIQVLGAVEFATNTINVDPTRAAQAITQMSIRRTDQTPGDIIRLLEARYGMVEVAETIGPLLDEAPDTSTRG